MSPNREPNLVDAESRTIGELEIAAVAASAKRDHEQAAELMKEAIKLEEEMGPPSGPPGAHQTGARIVWRDSLASRQA